MRWLKRKSDGLIFTWSRGLAKQSHLFVPATKEEMEHQRVHGHTMDASIDETVVPDLDVTTKETREGLTAKVKAAEDYKEIEAIVKPYGITNLDGRRKLSTVKKKVLELIDVIPEALFE